MVTLIWTFLWAWFHFAKYTIKRKLGPVCKISFEGVLVSYSVSLVCLIVFGLLAKAVVTSKGFDPTQMEWLKTVNPLIMFYAGIEDLIFVLPIFLLPKRLQVLGLTFSSILFTLGHSYQGDAMYSKIVTVPVVFLLAGRYGIFSTAVAHGLNDVIAIALLQYMCKTYPELSP